MASLLGHREPRRWSMRGRAGRQRLMKLLLLLVVFYIVNAFCRQISTVRRTISAEDIRFTEASNIVHSPIDSHDTFLPVEDAQKHCAAHGWRPFPPFKKPLDKRKVYDLFMINNELDWLEIRLNELYKHVDYFVIVESPSTFTGLPKPLMLQDNWARFDRFRSQIIHHVLEKPLTAEDSTRAWDHEDYQRNAMFAQVIPGLTGVQAANKGDVILVSDVDEIPRPAALQLLRNCDFPRRVTLRSRFYYYGFQWLHKGEEWSHPQATTYQGPSRTILPADLRNGEGGNRLLNWFEKADLFNAGWHCSSCFSTIDEMLTKMSSFSHTGLNKEEFRDRTRIVDRVRKGKDLWDREGEVYERMDGNSDIPKYLVDNREKFTYMLDRDGPSAGFRDAEVEESWVD